MKKLAIVVVATNKYLPLGVRIINRMNHFCTDKDNLDFYFFGNEDISEFFKDESNVISERVSDNTTWLESAMLRIEKMKEVAETGKYEYVAVLDADSSVNREFNTDELISDSLTFLHNEQDVKGVILGKDSWFPFFSDNKESIAYYDPEDKFPEDYYQVCYLGGTSQNIINMSKFVLDSFAIDVAKNCNPTKWTDEAYLQKYFEEYPLEYVIRRSDGFPIKADDKGHSEFFTGVDFPPFFQLSDQEYADLMNGIKQADGLWDIIDNELILGR
jgi:hypothetical protein